MKDSLKYLALLTQVGITILATLALLTGAGVYLDRWLGTGALFTLIFVLLGCVAALVLAYRLIMDTLPKDQERK